jgi:hypothetical protein
VIARLSGECASYGLWLEFDPGSSASGDGSAIDSLDLYRVADLNLEKVAEQYG